MYSSARARNSLWARSRTVCTNWRCSSERLVNTGFSLGSTCSDQPQIAQAGVAVAANDDVVVQHDAERGGGFLDVLGDGDVGL